ncbi:hypothetical protein DQ384_04500 [Sphaerisporangium album]|uniref:Uncharacterized protein n=1 Tax=Sphaerisporangium album TaxID=509200 RepID=A0A367FR46_9ACTN|nr:hypothetical protein DQ384_04500 [Sphaerisporangium album]
MQEERQLSGSGIDSVLTMSKTSAPKLRWPSPCRDRHAVEMDDVRSGRRHQIRLTPDEIVPPLARHPKVEATH